MKNNYEIRGSDVVIYITRRDGASVETYIDISDLPRVNEFPNSWIARWDPAARKYYICGAMTINDTRKSIQLSRWLLHLEGGMEVDHFNHNTLDNRKSNLRIVTHAQNMQNRNPEITNKYSKLRGVTYDKRNGKWHASLRHNNKRHFFGYFDTKEQADEAVKKGRAVLFPYSKEAVSVQTLGGIDDIYPDKTRPLCNKLYKAPRGIYWHKNLRKWHVMIIKNKVRHNFGLYESLEEAEKVCKEQRKVLGC